MFGIGSAQRNRELFELALAFGDIVISNGEKEAGSRMLARQRGEINAIIEAMASVRITEAELARDIHAVLAKVQTGVEVIVEQDHRTVAVIRSPRRSGRPISEILRQANERNSTGTLDPDFGKDLEAVIASYQQPWNPPSWE